MAHAQTLGAEVIVASSSGNHGAAIASAASRAGLTSVIFTLASIAPPMRAAIEGAGGVLVPLERAEDRWTMMRAAVREAGWYPASNFHEPPIGSNPYGIDGYKEIAWEIVRRLGDAPDWVVVPVGYGDGIAGIVRGFAEAVTAGLATRVPAALAAVTSDALPDALARGADQAVTHPVLAPQALSITGGFATYQALDAVRSTGGAARTVDDAAALAARRAGRRARGPPARAVIGRGRRGRRGGDRRRQIDRGASGGRDRHLLRPQGSAGRPRRRARRPPCRRRWRRPSPTRRAPHWMPGNPTRGCTTCTDRNAGPAAEHARKRNGIWAAVKAPGG